MVHFRLNAPVSFPFQPFGALSVEWLRQASLRKSERFGKLAADWWDPNGASAMLHKLNPCGSNMSATRSTSIGSATNARGGAGGKSALDVGCGAGL